MSGSATTTMYWSSETISMAKDRSASIAVSWFQPRLPGADDVAVGRTAALLMIGQVSAYGLPGKSV